MVKNLCTCHEAAFSLFKSIRIFRWFKTAPSFSRSRDIFIYLESACHDKKHGGFKIGARIAELRRFKVRKVKKLQEKDHLAIFKPANGFFRMRQRMVPFSAVTNGE